MTYPYICYMDSSDKRKPISRVKSTPNLSKEVGKLPPQSIDVEQVVLGAMMLEKDAVNDTIDILNRDSFYDPKHQYIFNAILELFANTKPIDLVTVTSKLQKCRFKSGPLIELTFLRFGRSLTILHFFPEEGN